MRFKLILRRSEILLFSPPHMYTHTHTHTPQLGHVVLMATVLLLNHTSETYALSSSLQWLTLGTSSQEGKLSKQDGERGARPIQQSQKSSACNTF